MTERLAIFVLGMHRSGASALAQTLQLLGATLPETPTPPHADNSQGCSESCPIVQFNESLLKSAGRPWYDPLPIPLGWWSQRSKKLHRVHDARQLLEREFPEGDLVVLKDPRISRLLSIWLAACQDARLAARALICCRNPLEVAASLNHVDGIGLQHALLLWLTYMLEAEQGTRGLPRTFPCFDTLLTDWRPTLAAAYDALGIDALRYTGHNATEIDGFLSPGKRHYQATTDQVLGDERLSPLLKDAWVAFRTSPFPSADHFDRLRHRLQDAWTILAPEGKLPAIPIANPISPQEAQAALPSNIPQAETAAFHRNVILHYHLFKNAGTSLDHIFRQNFGDGWHEREGPGPRWRAEDLTEYLRENPQIIVLSSHTALLPPPELPNTTVYPVIFLRHPIDRIRSIYEFEHKQIADSIEARMAKEVDVAGYIRWRLQREGDRAIRNFHAYRLAFAAPDIEGNKGFTEEERALLALNTLPFVGLVERFEESLARLQHWLSPAFPYIDFRPIKKNVTQKSDLSLEDRILELRDNLGQVLFEDLVQANALDLKIYEIVTSRTTSSPDFGAVPIAPFVA